MSVSDPAVLTLWLVLQLGPVPCDLSHLLIETRLRPPLGPNAIASASAADLWFSANWYGISIRDYQTRKRMEKCQKLTSNSVWRLKAAVLSDHALRLAAALKG